MPTNELPLEPILSDEDSAEKSKRTIRYICTKCRREVGRRNLVAKRVQFREMGVGGPVIKTRTSQWLCVIPNGALPSCRDMDQDWNAEAYAHAPGLADTRIAKKMKGKRRS